MRVTLQEQERRVILANIDDLVNKSKDNLIVECLYSLATQLSTKNSPELEKYTKLLSDIRAIVGQDIEPIGIGKHAIFKASNGYYYFKFRDPTFGKVAKVTHAELKDQFAFTWNRAISSWQKKQTNLGFSLDFFTERMTRTSNYDFNVFNGDKI